jgi:FAD/FMN-containing dehydrogenase
MLSRRALLTNTVRMAPAATLYAATLARAADESIGIEVNDAQSQLNPTRVHKLVKPRSLDDIASTLRQAKRDGRAVSLAGGRHSMGGQQFGKDTTFLDLTGFARVVRFDRAKGLIEVESGIQWPELIAFLQREQAADAKPWAIRQKQTGVDQVTIGGSLASNIHGRGLRLPPIIGDVESFDLLDARGKLHTCSRRENQELFALAIGGYGLFGVMTHVTLRLAPRVKLERVVKVIPVQKFLSAINERLTDGYTYGDCQYATDLSSEALLHPGVFACYRPVAPDTPISSSPMQLSKDDWIGLYRLARTDKKRAFEVYSKHYLATSGQVYWSDTSQLAGSFDYYHEATRRSPSGHKETEMISELYVPREAFLDFLTDVRRDLIDRKTDLTYGTIRLIEKDTESFLAWAREAYVCIVGNIHVVHTAAGIETAKADFRRVIDRAIQHGGRYFLTYHRWATRRQVETCYPQFVDFLKLKKKYDPDERFQSEWYRHYRDMFADKL